MLSKIIYLSLCFLADKGPGLITNRSAGGITAGVILGLAAVVGIAIAVAVYIIIRGVTRPLAKGGQGNEDFSLACERSERGSRGQIPLAGVQGAEPAGGGPGGGAPGS